MKESFRCLLRTISPVHIGCDEVYEPMGFVLDEQGRRLITFDPLSFIATLGEEQRKNFSAICIKGTISSILEIYQFLKGRQATGRTVNVCQGFIEQHQRTLSIPLQDTKKIQQELNNFIIARTSFGISDNRPFIPGSAIKGSIRTAYLNALAKVKEIPRPEGKGASKELEKTLLDGGAFSTDPFRMVRVSDFKPVGETITMILYAVNEKKTPSQFEARGPFQILEVIEPGSIFEGWITVEQPEKEAGIKRPISLSALLDSCNRFYTNEKRREDGELHTMGIPNMPIPERNGKQFLVRLGRHSGAESVTIEGYRAIKIMRERGQKPKLEEHATTLWLASDMSKPKAKGNLKPFGWALLEELTVDRAQGFEKKEKEWRTLFEKERTEQLAVEKKGLEEQLDKARKLQEAQRIKEETERIKEEEQQRRKAELEAMSPEERDIALIRAGELSEERVVEIYNKIDSFSIDNRKTLAQALKEYWIGHEKWEGKLSNKQKIKVEKIKGILGDT